MHSLRVLPGLITITIFLAYMGLDTILAQESLTLCPPEESLLPLPDEERALLVEAARRLRRQGSHLRLDKYSADILYYSLSSLCT